MNERIRELAEQADEYAKKYVAECKHYGYQMEYNEFQTRFEEKFAKLIVRECMRMCDVAAIGHHTHGHIKEANGCASAKEYIADWFEVE